MSGKMGSPTGRYKIVLAGHYRVGKTAIFRKLQSGEADGDSWPGSYGGEHQRSPQGVNLATGERSSMSSYASGREKWRSTIRVEQQHVNVEVWDTMGMERYGSQNLPTRSYFAAGEQRCLGVILVYDTRNSPTLGQLRRWIDMVKEVCDVTDDRLVFTLWGNEAGLGAGDVVDADSLSGFVETNGLRPSLVFSVNASTGDGIQNSLERLVAALIRANNTRSDPMTPPATGTGSSIKLPEGDYDERGWKCTCFTTIKSKLFGD